MDPNTRRVIAWTFMGCCVLFKIYIKMKKVDLIAKEFIEREGIDHLWYGNFDFCQRIAEEYWGEEKSKEKHPLTSISMVLRTVSRSKLFYKAGHINHLGRWYPVFHLK